MRVAVLGLGEAGSIYAADLARRGLTVSAFDPVARSLPPGIKPAAEIAGAVRGAAVVLSLVGGQAAEAALEEALAAMEPAAVFADMNTAGPAQKQLLAKRADGKGILFADVAILAPVPRARIETPLVVSGSGARELLRFLSELQIPAACVGDEAGTAAGLKLLRSVFMKGLAATILESVTAARAMGAEEWIINQIASELGPCGPALVARILEGTPVHAFRRGVEMGEARLFLESLGTPHPMTDGAIEWLHSLSPSDPSVSELEQPDPSPSDPTQSEPA
jgi:3-hydroxyisobutyrate dehydrogenase-like beta-hydroxyacid dehydrogenase